MSTTETDLEHPDKVLRPEGSQDINAHKMHIRSVRFWERFFKGVLWVAAGFTMSVLLLIIGYILVNGFYTRNIEQEAVASIEQDAVSLEAFGSPRSMAVVVHRGVRLGEIDYDTLRDIYLGESGYWGYITGQDRYIEPGIWTGDEGYRPAVADYLLIEDESGSAEASDAGSVPAVRATGLSSAESVEAFLRDNPGAIALVPAELVGQVRRGKRLGIQELSVAVHPGLTELVDGRRLSFLPEQTLPRILSGQVATWGETDQTITIVELTDSQAPEYRPVADLVGSPDAQAAQVIQVTSFDEMLATLNTTPGAMGLVGRRTTLVHDLSVLDLQYVSHSANLRPSFLWEAPRRAGEAGGISTIILNTLAVVAFVILIATPIGVAAAIYLVEYAKQGRLLVILRIGTDTLAGIPSIIFGLFGLVFFSQLLGFQTGLLAGGFTLTLMILPTIVRTAEEALRSVPDELREGSLALGATRMQTVFRVVLPGAVPGILTGVILGIGRAIGETAAVLFTMGSNLALIRGLNSPLRVLSVHLYMLVRETISIPNAFATATILVLIVLIINTTARRLIRRMSRNAAA